MMKNNRGFIAISVIYTFMIVFLMLLILILSNYFDNWTSFTMYKDNIKVKAALNYNYADNTLKLADAVKNQATLTSSSSSGVRKDNSTYGSYRYFGSAPNNYICFGKSDSSCKNDANYLFRIVGVFKESSISGTGSGYVTKIVRDKALTSKKAYGTKTGHWSNSSLKTYLNGTYLNTDSKFDENYKKMIINAKWYVPRLDKITATAKDTYDSEMKSSYTVQAKIGLISASDWGYAAQYNDYCKNTHNMNEYNDGFDHQCYLHNWLNLNNFNPLMWFIDEYKTSGNSLTLNSTSNKYNLAYADVTHTKYVYPAFYLNSKVVVMAGTGTKVDPYIVTLFED